MCIPQNINKNVMYKIGFMARNQIRRISVIKYVVLPICAFVF